IPLAFDCPTVATVCDLSVLLHPEWHPADRVASFERHFPRTVARCAHLLAISESGRQDILRTLGVPPEKVTRTYMGIRPGLGPLPREEVTRVLRRLGYPEPSLTSLGTTEPRKNVLLLLKAYCALPPALRERWPLVLVGGWGWNAGAVAEYLHDEARHRGVIHLGYLADEHLPAVYSGARALAYPSLYEGFGLPPLEMLACGGAVLASTAPRGAPAAAPPTPPPPPPARALPGAPPWPGGGPTPAGGARGAAAPGGRPAPTPGSAAPTTRSASTVPCAARRAAPRSPSAANCR